jgi:hypothetical protein
MLWRRGPFDSKAFPVTDQLQRTTHPDPVQPRSHSSVLAREQPTGTIVTMRVAALLLAACAAVSQAFVVPSVGPSAATRTRGVMQMLKVRAYACLGQGFVEGGMRTWQRRPIPIGFGAQSAVWMEGGWAGCIGRWIDRSILFELDLQSQSIDRSTASIDRAEPPTSITVVDRCNPDRSI